jgi:hypothetical protein
MLAMGLAIAMAGCGGDKKESGDKAAEAQKIIQEGMQKEKAMMEGMQKGVEDMTKKMTEQKDEAKK